jgi:general secretion pathway protein K
VKEAGFKRRLANTPGQQQGVALVIVLWVLLLITISTGSYTLMARMDQLEAHTVISSTRARMAAEAGLNLAVLSLRDPDELTRLVPDGRPYSIQFEDVMVEVQVTDERGKIDINSADEPTLFRLLQGNGMEEESAMYLAAAIMDWADKDEMERANGAELPAYSSSGLDIGPGNRPFIMIEEVLQVLGMPFDVFKAIEPGITVFSDAANLDPAYAPMEALMAIEDMTEEDALNFIEARQSQDASSGAGTALPNGQVAIARGRGLTYSVLAKATLPNGIWDQIEATIKLGASKDGRPFKILRWREGFHE